MSTLHDPLKRPPCRCCGGTGMVLDIIGRPRPCSRCANTAFSAWARQHCCAQPAPAPAPPASQESRS